MNFKRTTVMPIGLAFLFAFGLPSAPASAAGPAHAAADRIPVSVDVSARPGAAGSAVGVLDTTCADYRLCVWEHRDYGGAKIALSPGDQGWWEANFPIRSAKNRFGNRAVGFYNANTGERVRCLNPTTNLPGPFPDGTRLVFVGGDGSRC
ncbi:peptidase inhibitor family I36 protein [Saccharothrix longispora]|uniref:Peptidase inhibitor family I36 n=1 Tax=Saccharothrix longispora TaxID=33920 RepID=A0ABU1PRG1_9PSEU|nr:peptidase inhibitor family I36 protein [Saccharothrix longispora]MDR6593237.1 hypothetical protein [Saccharothrix longispora]